MANKIEISPGEPEAIRRLARQLALGGIPAGSRELYRGRNRVEAVSVDGIGEVNVKGFRIPIAINRFAYGWLRPSKARRAFDYGARLLELGVATPRPMAVVEVFDSFHCLHESYFVSEQLGPEWDEIRFVDRRDDFEELASALASYVASFHAKGVKMKDLSPGNVMFRKDASGHYEFSLVDTNRMKFGVTDRRELALTCGALFENRESRRLFAAKYVREASLPEEYVDMITGAGRL